MATMIRPSLVLKISVDERLFSEDLPAEIKRSYTHVAPSVLTSHPAGEGVPQNVLRFCIKLPKPYWDVADPEAEIVWREGMRPWLRNMFYKVSSNVDAFNDVRSRQGRDGLDFAWVELEFGSNALVRIEAGVDGALLPDDALEQVERAREEGAGGAAL